MKKASSFKPKIIYYIYSILFLINIIIVSLIIYWMKGCLHGSMFLLHVIITLSIFSILYPIYFIFLILTKLLLKSEERNLLLRFPFIILISIMSAIIYIE